MCVKELEPALIERGTGYAGTALHIPPILSANSNVATDADSADTTISVVLSTRAMREIFGSLTTSTGPCGGNSGARSDSRNAGTCVEVTASCPSRMLNTAKRSFSMSTTSPSVIHGARYCGLTYFFASIGITPPYSQTYRRKVLPYELENRVIAAYKKSGLTIPLFRKTSCAVAFAHREGDYNGHYGVPDICDICPVGQVARCANAYRRPSTEEFETLLRQYGYHATFEVGNGHITVDGLSDEERYHLQHALGFQVWDRRYPHLQHQHGRAPVGYGNESDGATQTTAENKKL